MSSKTHLIVGAVLAVITIVSCLAAPLLPGSSGFSGTFMADNRPDSLQFLSLTQSGNTVSGYLLHVRGYWPGGVSGTTFSVQGTVDGDAITLSFSSCGLVIGCAVIGSATGRKSGDTIVLTLPTESGTVDTLTFTPASQDTFNRAVAEFHQDQQRQAQATQIAIDTQEWIKKDREQNEQRIKNGASALHDSIYAIQDSVQTLKSNLDSIKLDLSNEQIEIKDMQADLEKEAQDAAVRPLTCYQVGSVQYDYTSVNYHHDSLSSYRKAFSEDVMRLESELSKVKANIVRAQRAAQDLERAMRTSKYPLPDLTKCDWCFLCSPVCYSQPGDEEGPIADYQAAADAASKELSSLKAADAAILKTADNIMAEGKSVLEAVKTQINCP